MSRHALPRARRRTGRAPRAQLARFRKAPRPCPAIDWPVRCRRMPRWPLCAIPMAAPSRRSPASPRAATPRPGTPLPPGGRSGSGRCRPTMPCRKAGDQTPRPPLQPLPPVRLATRDSVPPRRAARLRTFRRAAASALRARQARASTAATRRAPAARRRSASERLRSNRPRRG